MTARWVAAWSLGRVEIQPWQSAPPRMAEAGLSPADTTVEVWIVTPQGEVKGGAAAINEALRSVAWARPFASLYQIPVLRQLEDLVYRWVARNRYRFPGVTPACEEDG